MQVLGRGKDRLPRCVFACIATTLAFPWDWRCSWALSASQAHHPHPLHPWSQSLRHLMHTNTHTHKYQKSTITHTFAAAVLASLKTNQFRQQHIVPTLYFVSFIHFSLIFAVTLNNLLSFSWAHDQMKRCLFLCWWSLSAQFLQTKRTNQQPKQRINARAGKEGKQGNKK